MRVQGIFLCIVITAFLAFSCSQENSVLPEQVQVGGEVAMSHGNGGNALPEFTTLYWPAPDWLPSFMELDRHDGAGTHVITPDFPASPPGWDGVYPGYAMPYGLAYDIDGTVYALHNWFDGIEEDSYSQLVKIDMATGGVEPIGPVHGINFAGPEFDACGNLYATGFTVGPPEGGGDYVFGDSNLYRFDKHSGEKTLIGDTGDTKWMDLDFDSDGVLWGTFGNMLYTIDTETGASQFVTEIYGVQENRIPGVCEEDWQYMEVMGIAFDHNDVLWATAMRGFSWCGEGGLAAPVMTIDIATGVATLVGSSILDGQSHGGDIAPRKVTVCHLTNHGYKTISISLAALQSHLDHGDVLPGGEEGYDCDCQQ